MDQVRSDVALLYRRAGFGATPAQLDAATAAGYDATVEAFVGGLSGPDPAGDAVPVPTVSHLAKPAGPPGSDARKAQREAQGAQHLQLQRWWAQRMVVTSTPLREKLTLFWHGHFATGYSKVQDVAAMYEQNQLLRTAGAGSFEALTQAVAKGEAMMRWLDTATDKKLHPNENFARELMELFTLGIGNYGQPDVVAAARGFTGWVTDPRTGAWHLQAAQHDTGVKTYLGHTGPFGGEDIIHLAVTDPASARFVVAKLWSHFAYPVGPADQVVTDVLPAYGPGLDVAAALRAVFLHPGFRSAASRQGLVKQPIEYLVGAARALGLDADLQRSAGAVPPAAASSRRAPNLAALSTRLAQTLFDPPNVSGWGQNAYWLDTATALARLDIAAAMAAAADLRAVEAVPVSGRADAVAAALGIDGWGATTAAALHHAASDPRSLVAVALTAPEYVLA
ncbi:DUF1800 domain-containing protein [Acidiferrimicrobium sp. IK]|uniref:DUF1800 domain-containing protein n=1 Tax=Acidiferrimicrobium sp. IK TaxID=2871700 RepID=UPI0021CB43CB|nr:DUF1800 domain-containing protein [Acidiferrimicrobium sp. IK]MCU4184911.1 DUF1800 domain-containing protein [Acidiferrimicrobium sp. IK]